MPNRLTRIDSESSTYRRLSNVSMPFSWFSLNWLSVWTFASGKPVSALSSWCVFAAVTPPAMFTNV